MDKPSPEAERQIKVAVELILRGDDVEKVVRLLYHSAFTDGSLSVAKLMTEQLAAAMKAAA